MKKKNIINLIRCHAEQNEIGFKQEAYAIARDFASSGDFQLSEYIISLLSGTDAFVPQTESLQFTYLEKASREPSHLWLSEEITQDFMGVVNAIGHHIGMNKFLFSGAPGTGKTEAAKQLARILDRDLYTVNFDSIIDSRLGQTQKNIAMLFREMNSLPCPEKFLILFDEIDALALDRTDSHDLREMGRATSALLKGLDGLSENAILIATTNLLDHFDKALSRRFDSIVNFNRYTDEDLASIAEKMLDQYLTMCKLADRDVRLFRKIIDLGKPLPMPGDLKNRIRSAIAFSNPKDGQDYFRRLYHLFTGANPIDLPKLQKQKFTVREIGILTEKSKSRIARELKEANTFHE